MKLIYFLLISIFLLGCNSTQSSEENSQLNTDSDPVQSAETSVKSKYVNENGSTVKERISAPDNFKWVNEKSGSFGEFLQNMKLKESGARILDYTGSPIYDQSNHVAVVDKEIGTKDLQQCADAIIRLRSDYLWEQGRFDEIKYHFTSGDLFSWDQYRQGIRPIVTQSNLVSFERTANPDDSFEAYRKYLDIIYMYAGTISLHRETRPVRNISELKTGDILVLPGSPGHAVIIVGTSVNQNGKKLFLVAEGYTPAQSIHIVTNPYEPKISPWYSLNLDGIVKTARFHFSEPNFRSFE